VSRSLWSLIAGAALVAAGTLLPSASLVWLLCVPPPELEAMLLQGAGLFRMGLVVLGVTLVLLGRYADRFSPPPEAGAERSPARVTRAQRYWLAAILVTATVLRLYNLGEGLWFDEIVTYVRYTVLTPGEVITTYDFQNQHVLYTLLAKLSLSLFGESSAALRLPAALFGVASIAALFLLGVRAVGPREGLLAAALLTFSYHHVWFSQNARGYIGLLFWTLLSSWLLLRALDVSRPGRWLAYALSVTLGMYTHLTMLFVVAGHFAIYAVRVVRSADSSWPYRLTGLLYGFLPAGLLSVELYAWVLPQMFGSSGTLTESGAVEQWKDPVWAALELLRGLEVGFASLVVGTGAFMVFGFGCWWLWRSSRVVLALLFVPVAVCAAVAFAQGHHLWPRLFFFAIGFGALTLISGALAIGELGARLTGGDRRQAALAGTLLCLIGIAFSASMVPRAWAPKQDFRGALEFVERMHRPGDEVVTAGLAILPYQQYFGVPWRPVETLDALDGVRGRAERTWLVYTLPFELRALHPELMAAIERDFEVIEQFHGTLGGGTVFVSRYDGAGSGSGR
jgi:hypothetical protein